MAETINNENQNTESSFEMLFNEYPGLDNAYIVSCTNGRTFSGTLLYWDDEGIIISYQKTHPITVWINRDNICSISGITTQIDSRQPRQYGLGSDNRNRVHKPFYMTDSTDTINTLKSINSESDDTDPAL